MLDQRVRVQGIGGSEVAAILGLDPYRDAFSVWTEKRGLSVPAEPTPLMQLGKLMEKAIAQYYASVTGRSITWIDETRVHPARPWQVYTVDALCNDEPRGVDAKLVLGAYYEWGDNPEDVPIRVNLQARWYMAALDYPLWDIMAVVGATPRIYTIKRDFEMEDAILSAVESFYRRYLLTNEAPQPGASPATTRYLKERFRDHTTTIRDATPAESELLELYTVARQEAEQAEVEKRRLTNQLCATIAGDAGIRSEHCTLTWKRIKDSLDTDWQQLAEKLMDNYSEADRESLVERYTVPKPGYRRIHFSDRRRD